MSLNKITNNNIKWSFIEALGLKGVTFLLGIILARLLLPKDFGVLAIVNSFYLLTSIFIEGGFREALIQKNDTTEIDYSTVFWLNLGMSFILYFLLFVLAPYIESFYNYSQLAFYIRIQSLTLIIESFGIIQIVKATKNLQLKKITTAIIPSTIVSSLVAISMAYNGFGVIALIIQQLISMLLYNMLLVYNIRYIPKFVFSKQSIKKLYSFALNMLGISFLSRYYVQSLNLAFAYFFSPQLLGLYTKSIGLQNAPIEIVNTTFTRGTYPTMVKFQKDRHNLKELLLKNIKIVTFLILLINGLFFFQSYEIIEVLLGDKWLEMEIYLKIIVFGSIFVPINLQCQSVLRAINKPEINFKIELYSKLFSLIVVVILLLLLYELPFILISVAVIMIITASIYLYFISKLLKFSFIKEFVHVFTMVLIHIFLGIIIKFFINLYLPNIYNWLSIVTFATLYLISTLSFFYCVNRLKVKSYFKEYKFHRYLP